MTPIPNSEIAAIVTAARLKGPPTRRLDSTGTVVVRVLTLYGPRPGQLYDFSLTGSHRRWCLESVSDDHGVELDGRTLGRRLSARLDILHAQATAHFTDRPASP
ncbi:hypothetical protein ACFCYF_23685 [Streptomyces chartreusis]|uniref:hypothetical protein n=1 Tax=Streptomyces chartreusis TaxID=1969 RepID=UPI0035D8CF78